MQVFKGEHNLWGVEASILLGVSARLAQVGEHLTAADILENHVQVRCVLEAVGEADNERKVDWAQDFAFVESVLHLFHLDYVLLLQHLHGVALVAVALQIDYHDTTKAACAYGPVKVEVVESDIFRIELEPYR